MYKRTKTAIVDMASSLTKSVCTKSACLEIIETTRIFPFLCDEGWKLVKLKKKNNCYNGR